MFLWFGATLKLGWASIKGKQCTGIWSEAVSCFTWCLCWRESSSGPEMRLWAFVSHHSHPLMQWPKWGSFPRFPSGVKSWPFEVCNKTHIDSSPKTCRIGFACRESLPQYTLRKNSLAFCFCHVCFSLGVSKNIIGPKLHIVYDWPPPISTVACLKGIKSGLKNIQRKIR